MDPVLRDESVYKLAVAVGPDVIAAKVRAFKSKARAARALGVSEEVVSAGLALQHAAPDAPRKGAREQQGLLTIVKDVFGLFAGIAVLIYVLGGVVLFARLSYADLPNEAVFAQLPREVLITIGTSQVLIPALIAMVLHALVRLLRPRAKETGGIWLVGAGMAAWVILMGVIAYFATRGGGPDSDKPELTGLEWGLFAVSGVAILVTSGIARDPKSPLSKWAMVALPVGQGIGLVVIFTLAIWPVLNDDRGFWATTAGTLGVVIAAVTLLRHFHATGGLPRRLRRTWLTLTVAYGVVVMVVATAVAATFPLLEAKACFSAGFAESGLLVGQGAERTFLGERREKQRRIVSIPSSAIEELFIGRRANESDVLASPPRAAGCDPRGLTAGVTAIQQVPKARTARLAAAGHVNEIRAASTGEATAAAEGLSTAAIEIGIAARTVADATDSITAGPHFDDLGRDADDAEAAGGAAMAAGMDLRRAINEFRSGARRDIEHLRNVAEQTWGRAKTAAAEVRKLARRARVAISRASG